MADPLKQLPNAMAQTFSSMVSSLTDAAATVNSSLKSMADGGIQALTAALPKLPTGAGFESSGGIPNPFEAANQVVQNIASPIAGAGKSVVSALTGDEGEKASAEDKNYLKF